MKLKVIALGLSVLLNLGYFIPNAKVGFGVPEPSLGNLYTAPSDARDQKTMISGRGKPLAQGIDDQRNGAPSAWIQTESLTRLLEGIDGSITFDGRFADIFGISPSDAKILNEKGKGWLQTCNAMERDKLQEINQGGEVYYSIEKLDAFKEEMGASILEDVSEVRSVKNPELIANLVGQSSRLSALSRQRRFAFYTDEDGNLVFDAPDISGRISGGVSEGLKDTIEGKYGHLFDFDAIPKGK